MKSLLSMALCFLLLINQLSHACPTCIGRLDKNTPPFFSAEYDALHTYKDVADTPVAEHDDEEEEV